MILVLVMLVAVVIGGCGPFRGGGPTMPKPPDCTEQQTLRYEQGRFWCEGPR